MQAFTYNNTNRLTTAKVNAALVGTYAYNALGQRILKTYPDNTKEIFHYNETGQLIAVTNASGTTVREYIYNGSTLIGYVNAGVITYVHNDHQGTPQVITAQNQNVLWMADYEPFGKVKLNANNTIAFRARFPGQYLDSETGIYYNYFRDYDPSIGRYIESDPIGLDGGINTFAYVAGSPIVSVDPYGLSGQCSFYNKRCQEDPGKYYCSVAPAVCNNYPNFPSKKWASCVRVCLQKKDWRCDKNPNTCDDGPDLKCIEQIHLECWAECPI